MTIKGCKVVQKGKVVASAPKSMKKVSILNHFFKSCLALVKDEDALEELSTLIKEPHTSIQPKKNVNCLYKRTKTSRELRMNAQIGDYDMDFIILNFGADVNILIR